MRIATLVTGAQAFQEFQLFLATVEQWEPTAKLYVLTDTPTSALLKTLTSRVDLNLRIELDAYAGLTRKDMEAMGGKKYTTLFHDFTMEKAAAMQWALEHDEEREGVWLLDADICLLAPLPTVPPSTRLCLSPHFIRAADEARYGRFNAGMVWMRDRDSLDVWRRAAYGSRFYEQAALEAVWAAVPEGERVEFPIQDNFGWWRYLQSADPPPVIQSRLGFNRLAGCGLTYDGQVLRSVHTHWGDASEFNTWIRGKLEVVGRSHPPAKVFLQSLKRMPGAKTSQVK